MAWKKKGRSAEQGVWIGIATCVILLYCLGGRSVNCMCCVLQGVFWELCTGFWVDASGTLTVC